MKKEGIGSSDAETLNDGDRLPVPCYSPEDQITVLEDGEGGSYKDPTLYAVGVERKRAQDKLIRETGIPREAVGGLGLEWAIKNTPKEVGKEFDAHGIAKGDPVKMLDDLLKEGIDPSRTLHSMPFTQEIEAAGAFGAEMPSTRGGIIIVSGYGQELSKNGIKYVILDETYCRAIDALRKKYPEKTFLPWHKASAVFVSEANRVTGSDIPAPLLSEENSPTYPTKKRPLRAPKRPTPVPRPPSEEQDDTW